MRRSGTQTAAKADWSLASRGEPEDDPLAAAFELAYFIHRDRSIASEIVLAAMHRLEVAAVAQMRRLYYRGRGDGTGAPSRFKTSWTDRHLLQRLVYFESEKWERSQEQTDPSSLTEEDYLIRFVKHLSQITMKRSSFYASIAIGRILHAFSTAETMAIYDAVAPEGCERKQGDYFRARKAQLLNEVRQRFGEVLSILRGPHQEDRIECAPATSERAAWMHECLRITTPWATACRDVDGPAQAPGRDFFDRQEVSRFHRLFHPPCFSRLARALALADPKSRLAIPRFRISSRPSNGKHQGPNDRYARVLPEERIAIERRLGEESRLRRDFSAGSLRIFVDGRERARWDPTVVGRARFAVEESAEIVEVRGRTSTGDLLLAVHPLDGTDGGEARDARTYSLVLESGQCLAFRIARKDGIRTVELTYRETSLLRAARLLARRLEGAGREAARRAAAALPQPVAVGLLAGAVALLFLLTRGSFKAASAPASIAAPGVSLSHRAETIRVLPPSVERISSRAAAGQVRATDDAPPLVKVQPRPRRRPEPELEARILTTRALAPQPTALETAEVSYPEAARRRPTMTSIELPPITPLSAVRESFLQSLTAQSAPAAGTAATVLDSSDGVRAEARTAGNDRNPSEATLRTALAGSQYATETFRRDLTRVQWKPAENSPRVRVLRRVVSPELSDGARCGPQELACPIARISAKTVSGRHGEPGDPERQR